MADKTIKLSSAAERNAGYIDAGTECPEDFSMELEHIPSHPSFIEPLLEQGELSEDSRKLLRKIKQDPEWKKRVEKMLNFEVHTLKGRLSWEQEKLREQKRWIVSLKEDGEKKHADQLFQINQLKQSLREQLTSRIKLESSLAEDKRINKKLAEENKKAAMPRSKLTEVLNRAVQKDACQASPPPSPRPTKDTVTSRLSFSKQSFTSELRSPALSPSRPDQPSSSGSNWAAKLRTEHGSPKESSTNVPDKSISRMSPCQSEAVSVSAERNALSVVKSQESFKLPKIVNSPLISAPEPDPIASDTSTNSHITAEDPALSFKSACSRCGSKLRSENSPHRRRQEPPYPSPGYAYSSLPSHNLHLSSPPVIIQQAPAPYPYPPPDCHECSAHHSHPLHHACHQRHCPPCCPPREEPRFSQEFECLKDFIRDEIRSGWSKSPRSRRPKSYSSSRGYPSGTSTPSETESEDPYLVAGLSSSKGARVAKLFKPRMPYSGHSLAATHSLTTSCSDASSVLEDELFLKLVSNPAKYSHELQEIAKLLTSPPVSRASSTTSRQKLRTIKHLVREAITSYSASELESSDGETPRTPDESASEESELNPSRLDHVSSRALHKARRAKERCEEHISPKPSILKTASRPSQQAMETSASLTGIKRVNFSKETINIDDGLPVEIGSIPDDFVVVEDDEISLATQEMQASVNLEEERAPRPPTELVVYPYDLYMAGDRTEACTIVQNMTRSEEGTGRAEAAGRILSELSKDSEVGSVISVSHSLELKASLPSIPSYLSEVESMSALSQRPNRPTLESEASRSRMNPAAGSSSRQGGLLSHSSASLNQIIPRAQGEDELEQEKRSIRSRQSVCPEPRTSESEPAEANENQSEENCPPMVPPQLHGRRNSLTLREHESRRHSLTQMSKISLVSRPSVQHSRQPLLEEEILPITPQTVAKVEKQVSRSSLASKILSSISSLVSLKSNSGTKVAPQEIARIGESESNSSIQPSWSSRSVSDPDKTGMKSSASRSQSRQEDVLSRSQSRQKDIPSRSQSRQKDIPSRSQARQEDIPSRSPSRQDVPGRSQSKQEDIPSISPSRQDDAPDRSQSRQEDIPSRSQSRQEDILNRSQSKQEDIPNRSQSRQYEVDRTENDAKKDETTQEKVSSADVANVCTEDSSRSCDCSNYPEPVQCTDDCICANPDQELEAGNPPSQQQSGIEPTLSKSSLKLLSSQAELSASLEKSGKLSPSVSAPVKILLSPEVEAIKTEGKSEAEMGVKMTFSKEWKIICTKDCPDGVKETTITDWRDPNWEESEFYPREKELASEAERAPTTEGEELTNTSRSLADLQNSDERSDSNLQNSDERSDSNLQNSDEQSDSNIKNSDEQSDSNIKNSDEQSDSNIKNSNEQSDSNIKNSDEQSDSNIKNSDEQSDSNIKNSDEQSDSNIKNSNEQSDSNIKNSDEQSDSNIKNSDEQSDSNIKNSDEQSDSNIKNSDEQSEAKVDLGNKVDPPTGEDAEEKAELSEVEKIDTGVDDVLTPEDENEEIIAAIQSALQADQLHTDPTAASVASPSRDEGVAGENVFSKVEPENVPQEEGNSTVEKAMQLDEQLTQSIGAKNESNQSDSPALEKGEDQDEMTDPERKGNSNSQLEVVETNAAADIEPQIETDQPTDDTDTQTIENHVDSSQEVELSPLEGESLEQESGGNNPDVNVPSSNESYHA